MTEIETKTKLTGLKWSLRSLRASFFRNFEELHQDAVRINAIGEEILRLEEEKKDE